MDKMQAFRIIVVQSRKESSSIAANKRTIKAMKVLGLQGDDLLGGGAYLDVWSDTGVPFIQGSPSFQESA